jgi:hypothetical protein
MRAVVAYHSRHGHTRHAAEAIAAEVTRRGGAARLATLEGLSATDIEAADVLFAGTWAQGLFFVGVRPAGLQAWLAGLPSLRGKPTATFATYRLRPAGLLPKLNEALAGKGARVTASRAFRGVPDATAVQRFVDEAMRGVVA